MRILALIATLALSACNTSGVYSLDSSIKDGAIYVEVVEK